MDCSRLLGWASGRMDSAGHQARGETIPELRGPSPASRSLSARWRGKGTRGRAGQWSQEPLTPVLPHSPPPPQKKARKETYQLRGGRITLAGGPFPIWALWRRLLLTPGGTSKRPLRSPMMAHLELAHELCKDAKEGLRSGCFGVLTEEGQCPAQLLHGLMLQPVQCPQHRLGCI